MNIGKRKMAAGGGLVVLVAAAVVAYLIGDTDGLLAVTLAVLAGSTAVLGWFVANTERRLRRLVNDLHTAETNLFRERFDRLDDQMNRALTNEQAEQLLRAIQSGFVRVEGEWQRSHDELVASLRDIAEGDRNTGRPDQAQRS